MSKCRRIEETFLKGKFGESLDQLPEDLQAHLGECRECREDLESLVSIEGILRAESPTELSMSQRARIRMKVLDGISSRKHSSLLFPKPLWGFFVGGVIALVLIMQPWRQRAPFLPAEPSTAMDSETYAALLDYTVDPIVLNDENIETAIIQQGDSELLAVALEEWFSESVYDESVFSGITELEESDWNALRRYMI